MRKTASASFMYLRAARPIEVKELHAGDIGAIGKLDAATGDTLSTKANPIAYGKIEVSTPYTYKRYRAKLKGEEDKVAQALAKMAAGRSDDQGGQ